MFWFEIAKKAHKSWYLSAEIKLIIDSVIWIIVFDKDFFGWVHKPHKISDTYLMLTVYPGSVFYLSAK